VHQYRWKKSPPAPLFALRRPTWRIGARALSKSGSPRSKACGAMRWRLAPMLSKDFKEFVELLNANAVEYLIVGGYALAVHGQPRYTGDLDIWLGPGRANIDRVLDCLGLAAADFEQPGAVIQLGYPPVRIDLLTTFDGVTFADCYPRRQRVTVAGLPLPILSLDDFKANKRASGRPKDLADLHSLDEPEDDR
jgi:hypothetical protein